MTLSRISKILSTSSSRKGTIFETLHCREDTSSSLKRTFFFHFHSRSSRISNHRDQPFTIYSYSIQISLFPNDAFLFTLRLSETFRDRIIFPDTIDPYTNQRAILNIRTRLALYVIFSRETETRKRNVGPRCFRAHEERRRRVTGLGTILTTGYG